MMTGDKLGIRITGKVKSLKKSEEYPPRFGDLIGQLQSKIHTENWEDFSARILGYKSMGYTLDESVRLAFARSLGQVSLDKNHLPQLQYRCRRLNLWSKKI